MDKVKTSQKDLNSFTGKARVILFKKKNQIYIEKKNVIKVS